MTHNVWNCDNNWPKWAEKGEDCSAGVRVGALLRVYRETLPDIIGGQEVSALMLDLLKEGFQTEDAKYTAIWGRFTPILYRADKFDLIDSEFGTYPERIEGLEGEFNDVKSKSWNSPSSPSILSGYVPNSLSIRSNLSARYNIGVNLPQMAVYFTFSV